MANIVGPPAPGALVVLGREATPQLEPPNTPLTMRVVRTEPTNQDPEWVWLTGYELDGAGNAVEQRTIYARLAGIRVMV